MISPGFGRISRHGKGMGIQTREAFKCELKLMRLIQANPALSKQLMDRLLSTLLLFTVLMTGPFSND